MKITLAILLLFSFLGVVSCQRDDESGSKQIQREEEYDRDDVIERKNLPSPNEGKDFNFDRDGLDTDNIDMN